MIEWHEGTNRDLRFERHLSTRRCGRRWTYVFDDGVDVSFKISLRGTDIFFFLFILEEIFSAYYGRGGRFVR